MASFSNIFTIDSNPFGKSYGEWSVQWWQWICEIPKEKNPAFDNEGDLIHINQNDAHVIFLCQTIEGVENNPIRRNYIPAGKAIFMPIINWISIMGEDGNTDQELLETAKKRMDVVSKLELIFNDVKTNKGLEKYRIRSPFFYINLPNNNIFGIESGIKRCISDGYWLFFHPNFGNLKLSTFSSCSSGITQIKVQYILNLK